MTTDTRGCTSDTLVTMARMRTSCPTTPALTSRSASAFMLVGGTTRSSYLSSRRTEARAGVGVEKGVRDWVF